MGPEVSGGLGGPIVIRFDGLDAARHEIELGALAEALRGLSRIIGVAGNFAATQRFVQHKDALAVRVVTRAPERGCFEISVWLEWASQNSLIASTTSGLTVLLIGFIFKRAAGQREEMRQLRGALETAIKELGTRDQSVVDRLLTTVDRMADALRPAARQAVAPIGETAAKMTISSADAGSPTVALGSAEKAAISSEEEIEIGPEASYRVRVIELDVELGGCRLIPVGEPEERIPGKITDPALSVPNNIYGLALASQAPITVRAKPALRDGEILRLYISDAGHSLPA